LFRNKLENSEVIPGVAVKKELMRKLAVKEFLHFNPLRLNIYYAGGIIAAAISAVIIIGSVPAANKNQDSKSSQESVFQADTIVNKVPEDHISVEKVSLAGKSETTPGKKGLTQRSELKKDNQINKNEIIDRRGGITSVKSDSLKKTGVFPDNLSSKNNNITIQIPVGAAFDVSATSGCSPLKVKFLNKSTSFDSCRWVFGDGGFSHDQNPEWIFDTEGEYKIVLKVFGSNGTRAVASSVIIVHSRPVARFEITPEKPVIPDDEIHFINYSVDGVRYKWEFGDGNISEAFEPNHKYRKYNNYNIRLIAWSEFGCADSMYVKNAFASSGCFINFPNAFIPGSDGPSGGYYSTKSDEAARIFHPVTSGVNEFHLKIFSKQGILIFESNDISIGWDGYNKGQLCEPGVYIWKVRGTYTNGEPFVKMGDITLLRN
jgi:PKD repeat protein